LRSVRLKFAAVILLGLLPLAAMTRIFYFVSRHDAQLQIQEEMKTAGAAFSLELQDDISTLRVAARLIASDPDLIRELEQGDREVLHEHIDDFTAVYPDIRVYLTDVSGVTLASSVQRTAEGSLAQVPEVAAALTGKGFAGITRLPASVTGGTGSGWAYVLTEPIEREGRRVGAVLATFPLDRAYLDNTEKKVGLALALRVGDEVVAYDADHPDPSGLVAPGKVIIRELPDDRTLALTAFVPDGLGAVPGQVTVVAVRDVTQQFAHDAKLLRYRLLATLVIALISLVVGFALANPMVRGIQRIAAVMPGLARRQYLRVEGVTTGDEVEALARTYNAMIGQLQEGDRIREALGKYLSRAARDAIDRGALQLGGTTLSATVLFSDIRGFTSLSETMPPEQVLALLNRYFTEMVGAIVRHGGIVDKFIGDCIMAVWGPPEPRANDAINAVRAAFEMRRRLERLNEELGKAGLPRLRTGIGMHTGQVVAGNMGADASHDGDGKMEYTVIGDTVNVASRIESLTKELKVDVLLSEDTYRLVAELVEVEPLRRLKVHGRQEEVMLYRLVALREAPAAASVV
jgi:adenylate cyclase